jgi:hypothetical protein
VVRGADKSCLIIRIEIKDPIGTISGEAIKSLSTYDGFFSSTVMSPNFEI